MIEPRPTAALKGFDMPDVLTTAQRAFVRENAYLGVVTTLRADGSPHSTVVWVDEEDGDLVFNTSVDNAKVRHLRRDPRVSMTVVDPADQYSWIGVDGTARLSREGAREHIEHLSQKYEGTSFAWYRGEQRIIVRITPRRIDVRWFAS